MYTKEQFDWVEFYEEFAQKLLKFKTDRKTLISILGKFLKILLLKDLF